MIVISYKVVYQPITVNRGTVPCVTDISGYEIAPPPKAYQCYLRIVAATHEGTIVIICKHKEINKKGVFLMICLIHLYIFCFS